MRGVAALLLVAGCDVVLGLEQPVPPTTKCIGRHAGGGLAEACIDLPAPAWANLAGVDTGIPGENGTAGDCTQIVIQSDTDKTELCIVSAQSIELRNGFEIVGRRPFALVAAEDLIVGVDIDLTLKAPSTTRPGSGHVTCAYSTANGKARGGGGAGGSFGGMGGNGGTSSAGGGAGGTADPATGVGFVRGGCHGGVGGAGGSSQAGPGYGGGAIYLIAGRTITIRSMINASGGGGRGGGGSVTDDASGGGGGGSGGLIGLDAPHVVLEATATLIANGGGGGGGGGKGTMPADGGDAESAVTTGYPYPAAGGPGGLGSLDSGGTGGNGHDGMAPATPGAQTIFGAGAGGGGGGAGHIKIFSPTLEDSGGPHSPAYERS